MVCHGSWLQDRFYYNGNCLNSVLIVTHIIPSFNNQNNMYISKLKLTHDAHASSYAPEMVLTSCIPVV